MPLNIRDAESSIMKGEAKAREILKDWNAKFYKPKTDTSMALLLQQMTSDPLVAANLQRLAPKAYADAMKFFSQQAKQTPK